MCFWFSTMGLRCRCLESAIVRVTTYFCSRLPDQAVDFKLPSLEVLVRYWTDSSPDVMLASRSLFSATLGRLSAHERQATIAYWSSARSLSPPLFRSLSLRVPMA